MRPDLDQLYRQIVMRRIAEHQFTEDHIFDFRQILQFMNAQADRAMKRSDSFGFAMSAMTVFEAIYEQIQRDSKVEFDALVSDLRAADRASSGEGGDSGGGAGSK